MAQDSEKRGGLLLPAFMVFALGIAYLASYPVAVRAYCEWKRSPPAFMVWQSVDGSSMPVYKPVDWLIDKTPLSQPLFLWADVWGVRDLMETSAFLRSSFQPAYALCPSHPPALP